MAAVEFRTLEASQEMARIEKSAIAASKIGFIASKHLAKFKIAIFKTNKKIERENPENE